jgi:single-strand DNA-binding protein
MDGVNKVTLIGSVGKDAEVKFIKEGSQVAKFSVATNRSYKDKTGTKKTETDWHNVEVWQDTAAFAGQYVKKGSLVYIEGEIRYEKFDDKEGRPQQRTKIVANKIQLLPKGNNGAAAGSEKETKAAAKQTEEYAASAVSPTVTSTEFAHSSQDDDLPF